MYIILFALSGFFGYGSLLFGAISIGISSTQEKKDLAKVSGTMFLLSIILVILAFAVMLFVGSKNVVEETKNTYTIDVSFDSDLISTSVPGGIFYSDGVLCTNNSYAYVYRKDNGQAFLKVIDNYRTKLVELSESENDPYIIEITKTKKNTLNKKILFLLIFESGIEFNEISYELHVPKSFISKYNNSRR